MYTQCPNCSTLFRINTAQLTAARGQVRCGLCRTVFDALETLAERVEDLPKLAKHAETAPAVTTEAIAPVPTAAATEPGAATMTRPAASPAVPDAMISEALRTLPQGPTLGTLEHTAEPQEIEQAAKPAPQPYIVEPSPSPFRWLGTAAAALGNLALIALLVAQYAYFNRNELAQYPELRPWLMQLCGLAQCEIPLRRNIAQISLVDRLVHSHPARKDALLINATLVNEAGFPQPYPVLELHFTDLNGKVIAGRRFQPVEYLKPDTDLKRGMSPRTPVTIALEIIDPGKRAVGFEFSLI